MESVPEENNQIPNDNGGHKDSSNESKNVFSSVEILEIVGVVIFEGTALALHEADFHFLGFALDFLAFWCGLLVVRHRLQNSKFKRFSAPHFYWLSVICAFLLFAFLAWTVSFKKSEQSTPPAFSVEISSVGIPPDKSTNFFLLGNVNDQVNECLSPVNEWWAVQITNLKEMPLKIKSYQFECQTAAGNWEAMQTIDPRYGNIICRDGSYVGIFYPMQYGIEHFFPQILENRILESGIPITGFTYLETSQKISYDKIRLRISTPAGEYVEPAIYNPTNHLQTQTAGWTLDGTIFFAMTNDISKVPVKSYSDFPYK